MRHFVTNQTLSFVSCRHLSPEMRFSRRHAAIARGGVQLSPFVGPFLGSRLGSEVGRAKLHPHRIFVLQSEHKYFFYLLSSEPKVSSKIDICLLARARKAYYFETAQSDTISRQTNSSLNHAVKHAVRNPDFITADMVSYLTLGAE